MLKFARVVHFDDSDLSLYDPVAPSGEWAVSGGFAFADWQGSEDEKARNAFEKGWLGVGSFGRATAVMVAEIEPLQLGEVRSRLAGYLARDFGAPDHKAALAAADQEIAFMQELCESQDLNTVLLVHREMTEAGVHEECRAVKPRAATVH